MATYYVPDETGWRDVNGNLQYVRLKVDQTYTSATNKSALSITLQFQGPADSTWRAVSTAVDHYVKVKGSNDSESTFDPGGKGFVNNQTTGAWVNLTDSNWNQVSPYSYTVTHNADGTASISFTVKMLVGLSWRGGDGQTGTLSFSNTPTYTLSISQGTGSTVSVLRGSTALSNGAQVYRNESLTVNFTASTGYSLGTHTVNGTTRNSGYSHTVDGSVSVVATATVLSYTLSISPATGSSISVSRQSSPKQGAATGTLANGATVYYSDTLKISAAASTGYDLGTLKVNGSTFTNGGIHTVTGAVSVTTTASPSTSTVAASNGNFGQAVTITVTRRSSSYTHTVTTSCLGQTETLVNKGTTTSISWTPALATYAPLIPNAMSASATITCTTYNGNTAVGTHTISITLSLRAQDVKPTVSIAVEDPLGYATTYGGYVATKSKIRVTLTNTLKYGATLKTTAITANGENFSSSPATTGLITSTSDTSVTAAITDSRGQSSGTQSTTITILAYNQPKINSFSVHRSDGNGTTDESGAYMRVDYNVAITALNNHNAKTLEVKYKKRSVSSWSTQSVSMSAYTASGSVIIAADTESTYDVQLSLADAFQTTSITTQLSSAHVYPMNFKAGGKGVAFGKVSEIDKSVEIAADWTLYNGTKKIRPEALNLGRADYIVYSGDFNNFTDIGTYGILSDSIAASMSNRPCDHAGLCKVYSSNGDGKKAGDIWFYVTQKYTSIYGEIYVRRGTSSSDPTISWGSWTQTPAESSTNYCKMADGTLIQWGLASNTSSGYAEITFPTQFTDTNYSFVATPAYGAGYNTFEIRVIAQSSWSTGGYVYFRNFDANTPYTSTNVKAHWIAIGRWKA